MIRLNEAFVELRSPEEAAQFMDALFSPAEIEAIEHRWQAFQMLVEGATQRTVSNELGVGIATASRAAAAVKQNKQIIHTILRRRKVQGSD